MSQSSAYLDELGQPRLRTSIVAFVDVLGFSNMSTASVGLDEAQRTLTMVAAAIKDSRDFVRKTFAQDAPDVGNGLSVKFFSDNLALGCPCDTSENDSRAAVRFVLRCAQRYQLRMVLNGFFVRGAMSIGLICLTDEIIFGSALVECYQGESKAAIVPRVLLSESLWKVVSESLRVDADAFGSVERDLVCRDIDGWWFVNYLQAAHEADGINWSLIERHKQSILESLSHATRHDVLPKFGWACRYHNVFCHWHREAAGYSDRYRIERIDEQSTICRLSDLNS